LGLVSFVVFAPAAGRFSANMVFIGLVLAKAPASVLHRFCPEFCPEDWAQNQGRVPDVYFPAHNG